MHTTVRDILDNLLYLVERHGFVPNGGRIYHLRRSQPPFLCLMVQAYLQASNDTTFLSQALPLLEREMKFWMDHRRVEVQLPSGGGTVKAFRYRADSNQPWPEDYQNQVELAKGLKDEGERRRLFRELATDAESGLDHSSRWMRVLPSQLTSIETSRIVPVDLNALLCGNFALMAGFYRAVGDEKKAEEYRTRHEEFVSTFR